MNKFKNGMHITLAAFIFLLFSSSTSSAATQGENVSKKQVAAASNTPDTLKKNPSSAIKPSSETKTMKVTFVEFGSVNCIPCKMMQPIMQHVEKEYGDQVEVVFHDVWTEQGKPYGMKYGIRSIPTQVFLDSDGKEFFRHEGFFAKDSLINVLKTRGVN